MCLRKSAMNTFRQSAELLKAMAHPARLQILYALRGQEECAKRQSTCALTKLSGHTPKENYARTGQS
jgi:DNA-binding transcriptional ArsR family regulator